MEFQPIMRALWRNRTGAVLVALQIALALAIVVNSLYIIVQRLEHMGRDPGLDVANTFMVSFAPTGSAFNAEVAMREDVELLRALPGVVDATTINAIPLSGGGSSTMYYTEPGEKGREAPGNYFEVDEHGVSTLGVRLVEGRNFDASVVTRLPANSSAFVPEIIVTRTFAKELFPDEPALGRTVYDGLGQPTRIVGILERMHGAWVSWDKLENVVLHPLLANERFAVYLVRAQPGQRDAVMRLAEEKLSAIDNGRILLKVKSLEEFAANSYADDRAMTVYLSVVVGLLLAISALGIFGLAAFNVSTRTKQIGTRRAVGARRFDIVRYFMVENWVVTSVGVLAGCVLALALGYWLSSVFELPRLKLYYLVAGMAVLWVIGLAAAVWPARRAARVSPAVATRTV
ncbi:MAG TPA: FtsX-like permease family protein [Steroidobacteraceae bacterium]